MDNIEEIKESDPGKKLLTLDRISQQMIYMCEASTMAWGIKDCHSTYAYSNKAYRDMLNLPPNFSMEGRSDKDLPHPVSEYAFNFRYHDERVQKLKQNISALDIYPYGRQVLLQPYICEKFPLFDEHTKEMIGVILKAKPANDFFSFDMSGEVKAKPASFVFAPPSRFFTKKEWEVVFFVLRSLSCKEIAKKMHLSHRTIENKLQVMYRKADVTSLRMLREFCRAKNFDKYVPEKYLKPTSYIID